MLQSMTLCLVFSALAGKMAVSKETQTLLTLLSSVPSMALGADTL